MRQDGVHEGQPEDAKEPVDQSCVKSINLQSHILFQIMYDSIFTNDEEVPVVSVPFDQLVVWRIHHGGADVLVHEEQQ